MEFRERYADRLILEIPTKSFVTARCQLPSPLFICAVVAEDAVFIIQGLQFTDARFLNASNIGTSWHSKPDSVLKLSRNKRDGSDPIIASGVMVEQGTCEYLRGRTRRCPGGECPRASQGLLMSQVMVIALATSSGLRSRGPDHAQHPIRGGDQVFAA